MSVLRASEIRAMSKEDRSAKLAELRAELARERARAVLGGVEKPANMRNLRKTIARILTVSREEK